MTYTLTARIPGPFDAAVQRVRAALAEQGFGVITEIDMKETLHKKIGADIDDQVILGACNPGFAHEALQAEPSIGVLLPCNVVIRSEGESVVVETIDPQTMVDVTHNPRMAELAGTVSQSLQRVVVELTSS